MGLGMTSGVAAFGGSGVELIIGSGVEALMGSGVEALMGSAIGVGSRAGVGSGVGIVGGSGEEILMGSAIGAGSGVGDFIGSEIGEATDSFMVSSTISTSLSWIEPIISTSAITFSFSWLT